MCPPTLWGVVGFSIIGFSSMTPPPPGDGGGGEVEKKSPQGSRPSPAPAPRNKIIPFGGPSLRFPLRSSWYTPYKDEKIPGQIFGPYRA